jgi:hypothetical protein
MRPGGQDLNEFLPMDTVLDKYKRIANIFPSVSTNKIDAPLSKLTDTQDGTEQQPEE